MEKNIYNPNYPQMPTQMASADGNEVIRNQPAPPSYDQATGSSVAAATYPPVQVLPTPREQQQHQQQRYQSTAQPAYATHMHNPPTINVTTTYPAPTGQPAMVIIQQPAVLPLGPEPTYIICPSCHIQKLTRIEYEPSSRTHLMAALLCILGLWCCVCLPYCAGSCMNANHYCGNCNKFLGTYGNGL